MSVSTQNWPSLENEFKKKNLSTYERAATQPHLLKEFWLSKPWLGVALRSRIRRYVDDHESVLSRCAHDAVNLHFILETLVYTVWDPTMKGAHSIIKSLSSPDWKKIPRWLRQTAIVLKRYATPIRDILIYERFMELPQRGNCDAPSSTILLDSDILAARLDEAAADIEARKLTSRIIREKLLRKHNLPYGAGRLNVRENAALLKLRTLFKVAGVKDCHARLAEAVEGAFSKNPDDKSISKRIKSLAHRDPEAYKSAIEDWKFRFKREGVIKPPKK